MNQNPHPMDDLAIDLDGPRSNDSSFTAPNINDYFLMKCFNLSTGVELGYLSTGFNAYATIEKDISLASKFKFCNYKSDLYLQKETEPNDRYLGVGAQSYACYGLWTPTGWVDAIILNPNGSISLKSKPERMLYVYGNNYVCWSDGESNQNILSFKY